jgi:hypothetical protein
MAQPGHNRLAELDGLIRKDLDALDRLGAAMVRRSMNLGDHLIEAKSLARRRFGVWLRERNIEERDAQRHMARAKYREAVEDFIAKSDSLSDLTLSAVDAEIARLRIKKPKTIPAPSDDPPVLRQHDVLLLGRHILICGDASVMKVGMGLAGKGRPRLLVTDPPYGIQIDDWDTQADWREVWTRYPGDAGFVFFEATVADEVLAGLKAAGFKIVDDMVWRKPYGHKVGSLKHRHEMIYLVTREGKPFPWAKGHPPLDSVLEFKLPAKERDAAGGHLTPKPIALIAALIEAASEPSDVVLDPFAGSGSTLFAAESTDRICLAIEREPAHCDIIARSWPGDALLWQGGRRDPIPFSELGHNGERHQPLVRMLNRQAPD